MDKVSQLKKFQMIKNVRTFILGALMLSGIAVSAEAPKRIIIFNGYFFTM